MKKVFSLLITLAMLISTAVVPMTVNADASVWDGTTTDAEWAGEGTEESPYLITSAAELAGLAETIADAVSTTASTDNMPIAASAYSADGGTVAMYFAYTGKFFKLTTDIDLGANNEWTPIGRFLMRFNGVFNGDGHVVKNVYMRNEYSAMGLFGATGSNARIIDLGVDGVDVSVTAKECVDYEAEEPTKNKKTVSGLGGLVGLMCQGGTANAAMIEGCYAKNVKMEITNDGNNGAMGGLFGAPDYGTAEGFVYVKNCYVMNVDLKGYSDTTGAVGLGAFFGGNYGHWGYNYRAKMGLSNCYVGGTIKLTSTKNGNGWSFGSTHPGSAGAAYSKCYTTSDTYTIDTYDTVATKDEIVSAFATEAGWSADNAKTPINDGYPVLAWENTWESVWDGTTDSSWKNTGDGTESDPYEISNAAQLADLANKAFYAVSTSTDVPVVKSEEANVYNSYTGVNFKLMTDINLNNEEWLPIGRHGMRFNGVFDGNNHVIKNLKITTNYFGVGLFGATGSSAVIKNLGIDTADIAISSKGANNVGAFESVYAAGLNTPDKTWTTDALFKTDRTNGAGTLIGLFSGGTVSDCYVKDTKVKNTNASSMFLGGFIGSAMGTITSGTRATITVTNSYANGVSISGSSWNPAVFIGNLNYRANASIYPRWVNLTATNCYVTDFTITDGSPICTFTAVNNNGSVAVNTVKCYTDSASFKDGYKTDGGVVTADKATITAALVTGNNAWNLDSVKNPKNGGYPVLGWEKDWTEDTDPMSFYKGTGVTVADGKVTNVTVIQSDSTVTGTVVVAVYDGTRFMGATTATAANGAITLETPIEAAVGNTVKVFVWDSMTDIKPLAVEYSTIVAADE